MVEVFLESTEDPAPDEEESTFLSVVVGVFVESTEDPALDEESTFVEADSLVVKYVCVDRKVNIAAGVDEISAVNSTELDVAAAMVAVALRSVTTTSVPGIRYHWCHFKLIDTCHGRPFRYLTPEILDGRSWHS